MSAREPTTAWAWRGIALLLLVPAATSIWLGADLLLASWPIASAGRDPLAMRLSGRTRAEEPSLDRYRHSSEIAGLDFRYASWRGQALSFVGPGATPGRDAVVRAREAFLEAARRAPSFAELRYYLASTAIRLGRPDEADAQADAALTLAPLNQGLRSRVAEFYRERFRRTRSEKHMLGFLRAADLDAAGGEEIFSFPLLTFDGAQRIFDLADYGPGRRIGFLERVRRWDWALRLVSELPDSQRDLYEGSLRESYGIYLAESGRWAEARRELELGLAARGPEFDAYRELGEARLEEGEIEGGLDALRSAVETGIPLEQIRKVLLRRRIASDRVEAFWRSVAYVDGATRSDAALELARALVAEKRYREAEAVLRPLLDRAGAAGEASFLMARLFQVAGNPAMALRYARIAVGFDSENEGYRRLAEALEGEER